MRPLSKKISTTEAREILGYKSGKTVVKLAKEGHFRMIPGEGRTSKHQFFLREILDFNQRREQTAK